MPESADGHKSCPNSLHMPSAKAPVRIDLAGGWSDAPPFCEQVGGDVVNIAINHYAHAKLDVDNSW